MKNRLSDKNYINRLNSNQLAKLTKIAEHLNISIEVVLDEIINAAYDLLPNTVKQPSTNKIKTLVIPSNIINFKDLGTYLRTNYNSHNEFVFDLQSYNLLANNIAKYKIAPSNLREYLKYHYPKTTVTIKD